MSNEHEWQELYEKSEDDNTRQMSRMRVDGGWLYIFESIIEHGTIRSSVAMEFVPDAKKTGQPKAKRRIKRT